MNKLDKQYTDLITLTKSDAMYLIACAMGYGWNEAASSHIELTERLKRKETESEKLLEWSIARNEKKYNEQTR